MIPYVAFVSWWNMTSHTVNNDFDVIFFATAGRVSETEAILIDCAFIGKLKMQEEHKQKDESTEVQAFELRIGDSTRDVILSISKTTEILSVSTISLTSNIIITFPKLKRTYTINLVVRVQSRNEDIFKLPHFVVWLDTVTLYRYTIRFQNF